MMPPPPPPNKSKSRDTTGTPLLLALCAVTVAGPPLLAHTFSHPRAVTSEQAATQSLDVVLREQKELPQQLAPPNLLKGQFFMKDVFGNKVGKRTIECDLKETARVLYEMYIPHVYHLGPGRLRVESNRQFLDPDKTLIEQGVTTQTSIEFVPDFYSGVRGGGMTTRGSSDADAADAAKAARLSVPVTEMDVWAKGMRVVVPPPRTPG